MARIDPYRRWMLTALLAGIACPVLGQARPSRGGGTSGSGQAAPRPGGPDVVVQRSGRVEYIVVVPTRQAAQGVAALQAAGATLQRVTTLRSLGRVMLILDLPGAGLNRLRAALAQVPTARVDLHHLYRFAGGPRLYAAALLGETAATPCRLSRRVKIGLIDGPVDRTHPALQSAGITVTSVLRPDERPRGSDHATAIAGLMVGEDSSGVLAGYAQGAELTAVAAFSAIAGSEGADVERIGMALDLLLAAGVRLINMSFAGPPNQVLGEVLTRGLANGAVIVAAVGNNGGAEAMLPAGLDGVIGVTAVDAARHRYAKANRAGVDFAAPGVDLYAAKGRAGGYVSGTSFAAPIVTAYAARLMAQGKGDVASLRRALAAGATDLGQAGPDAEFGWGLVQAPTCR
ncbi:MAG: S8 family serine peptidase [bacterium]